MSDARHRKPGAHRLMPARRRAAGLPGTLGVTFLGALAPGVGYLYARRRLLGWLVLASAVAALGFALWYVGRDLQAALTFATDPTRLKIAAALLGIGLLTWLVIVISTYRMVRPEQLTRKQSLAGGVFVALLCLAVVAPTYVGARYAMVQADLVGTVFEDNQTATAPQATKKDPWAGRSRVNVLLLGGDGGLGRDGIRTDSVILMSIATKTGKATLFSLPRNMMLAPFPEDSPLHAVYPSGFTGAGSDGNWMLNAIYKVVPEQHPGILGKSANEGADAIKLAVSATLGIEVDYYALVNLAGFKEVVDAMGGVTVNVNQRVAIHGDSSAGIPRSTTSSPGPTSIWTAITPSGSAVAAGARTTINGWSASVAWSTRWSSRPSRSRCCGAIRTWRGRPRRSSAPTSHAICCRRSSTWA